MSFEAIFCSAALNSSLIGNLDRCDASKGEICILAKPFGRQLIDNMK